MNYSSMQRDGSGFIITKGSIWHWVDIHQSSIYYALRKLYLWPPLKTGGLPGRPFLYREVFKFVSDSWGD